MTDAMISAAGMRIIRLLVGSTPKTIPELISATGVTRTAVSEQLRELVEAGFVEQTTERLPGRGRPRNLYSATQSALLLLFASNQRLVVPAIWTSIREVGGEPLVRKVIKRLSDSLAEHYRQRVISTEPSERLREFIQLLYEEGVLIEADEDNGQIAMRKRSCPFISMLDERHIICEVDVSMISSVVGHPVRQTQCRHNGAPCCTFELADDNN